MSVRWRLDTRAGHFSWRRAALALSVLGPLAGVATARSADVIEPIRFRPGASSAVIRGAVIRGERALYTIGIRAGQRMTLRIAAVEGNAAFQVYAPGARPERHDSTLEISGKALSGAAEGDDATRWTGAISQSGMYLIVVGPTRGNADYRLNVAVR